MVYAHTYAKIKNGTIAELGPRPKWRDEDGQPASDEVLRAGGYQTDENGKAVRDDNGVPILATDLDGWLPVIYDQPDYDPDVQRIEMLAQTEWAIETKRVVVAYVVHDLSYERMQHAVLERINNEYSARTTALAVGYPEDEQKSWPVQITEADIVLGDDDQPTPWIDNAAPGRGVTREELAGLIKAQDTAYRTYHGQLTGIRQALRNQALDVPDDDDAPAAFAAIQWPEE